ncbi:hypothetical protein Agabi119p4_7517 [Agaricus bisporus var. burnettii]|uniref:Cytochrome P450 n=1 Tax=Agaricus bisporus var. burnettii TaxID=192524 RepID=A0A8H7EZ02_AGABI|nr:hypothetical protein Agabi119p4_7517 [Agaricus bisporus var. burnettii]
MASLFVQALFSYVILAMFWKLFREYFIHSPLDYIPGPPAPSGVTGNISQLYDKSGRFYYAFLRQYGGVIKLKSLLGERLLFLYDPKALYHILIKDQDIYEEAPAFIAINKLFFGEGLMSTAGKQHKKQRRMLNPVFSTGHMREMTPIVYGVAQRLREAIINQVQDKPSEIDMLHWMTRTSLEIIGQSGMGYSFDSLENDADSADIHPYSRSVKRFGGLLSGTSTFIVTQYILPFAARFDYPRFKRWIVDHLPSKWVQDLKDISDVILETAVDIYNKKRQSMEQGDDRDAKKDIISVLMRANASAAAEDRLTDEEVFGQVASLTFAAMDTTSSALARILYLLAEHQDVQDKLRSELLRAKEDNHGQELSYDQLMDLPYLEAVCRETLRRYPPQTIAIRTARQDIVLPLSKPINSTKGTQISEVMVPSGTTIFLSLLGANINPEWWGEDSYEWKPDRWTNPLPTEITEARLPGIYTPTMTFLGGSRSCIGFKFVQLEIKVVLSVLLTSFKVENSGKDIMWTMPGIASPVVEGEDITRPSLPLKITLIDG